MRISLEKKEKIQEQILAHLFSTTPRPIFTSKIAKEIARDEEFTKKLLMDLAIKGLVVEIKKNSFGQQYLKRSRWALHKKTYELYLEKQGQ